MQLPGRGEHHGRDAVGPGSWIGREVQWRAGVGIEAPADANAQQHRHDKSGGQDTQSVELRPRFERRHLRWSALGLQIGHQGLQVAQRDGVSGRANAFSVFFHRELATAQGVVENPAGVLPIADLARVAAVPP